MITIFNNYFVTNENTGASLLRFQIFKSTHFQIIYA